MDTYTVHRPDEAAVRRILDKHPYDAVGMAVRLAWLAGLVRSEIVALRWADVNFLNQELTLPDRSVPLSPELEETAALTWAQTDLDAGVLRLSPGKTVELNDALASLLAELRQAGGSPADTVIRSPRSRAAMRPDRLSRITRAALVRAGLDDLSLRDLRQDYALRAGGEERILRYAREHGSITRNALMELFQISKPTAYRRLAQLTERGRLVRVGTRYYLPAAVVPPKEQYPVIRAYLLREGGAYRQELAQLLHVEPKQCSVILRRLVEEGKLQRDKYRYTLREA